MADTSTSAPKTRRPLVFVLLGLVILAIAGLLLYDRQRVHTSIAPLPSAYTYTVQQSAQDTIHYSQSSFFGSGPGAANKAFIADITKDIAAQFHYHFSGSKPTDLSYEYFANATLQSNFGTQGSDGGIANVWSKQYQLLAPVSGQQHARTLTFDPHILIPFEDYRTEISQFNNSFKAPLSGQLVVTFTVQVSGQVNGTPFTDTKVSTITAPLDQVVYELAVKYAKIDHQQIQPASSKRLADTITQYELPAAILLSIIGVGYIIYGFRKQIFKTPYMRELERIYRFHDGIIVRASRPTSFANKNVVPVQSFDDLLNLEEELKSPIVASPAGDNATQFLIARDDIIYVYTLGDYTLPDPPPPQATQPPIEAAKHKHPVNKRVSG